MTPQDCRPESEQLTSSNAPEWLRVAAANFAAIGAPFDADLLRVAELLEAAEQRATAAEHERDFSHQMQAKLEAQAEMVIDKLAAAEQARDEALKLLKAHRLVGAQLANICYNVGDNNISHLSERALASMRELRQQWDALPVPPEGAPQ